MSAPGLEMKFCRRCGTKLHPVGEYAFICTNNHTIYASSTPAVGVFFVDTNDTLLLSRRAIEPGKGLLDCFGGFVDGKERAEDAAIRELQEELRITPDMYEPLTFLCTAPGNYLYEGESIMTLSTFFVSRLKPGVKLVPSDDVAEVVPIPLAAISSAHFFEESIKTAATTLQETFTL